MMKMIMNEKTVKIIHVARIFGKSESTGYLILKKVDENTFRWYEEVSENNLIETSVTANTIEEAIRLANRHWKSYYFSCINCGFRYTLPERDEHGINALFHQMVSSYSSLNGIYYDDELGNNCIVQNASSEACLLWKRLR